MSLKDISREEIMNMSMLEIASMILKEEKKALSFQEIFNRLAEIKEFTEEQKEEYIAQFYTDLNVDGRFTTLGSNIWGLKRWYPIEQADEEVHTPKKKKKATKKKRKEVEDELEDDILDEDLDEEFDDEDLDEDLEDLVEEDDDLEKEEDLDEDLDKDLEEFDDFDEDEEEIDEEFDDEEFDGDEKEEEDR